MFHRAPSSTRVITGIAVAIAVLATPGHAGVINPDISVIGQPFLGLTDDNFTAHHDRPQLDVGETEFVFDAALNPYAHGTFILTLTKEGFELEEGFFSLVRGFCRSIGAQGRAVPAPRRLREARMARTATCLDLRGTLRRLACGTCPGRNRSRDRDFALAPRSGARRFFAAVGR